jgi:hypothetical protein
MNRHAIVGIGNGVLPWSVAVGINEILETQSASGMIASWWDWLAVMNLMMIAITDEVRRKDNSQWDWLAVTMVVIASCGTEG